MSAEERYASVVAALTGSGADHGTGDVTQTKMFGSPGLKVGGKFFACLYKGQFVVKLPRERVDSLAAAGEGTHFDPGMGRQMKEWLALPPESRQDWPTLA